jgi:hypothetical protein
MKNSREVRFHLKKKWNAIRMRFGGTSFRGRRAAYRVPKKWQISPHIWCKKMRVKGAKNTLN